MRQIQELMKELAEGRHDVCLQSVYVDAAMIPGQKERYRNALKAYETVFGSGEVEVYSAPGRSEVGGNHTDHQHGMVIATSVNLDAIAVVGKNADNCIRVLSEGYDMVTVALSDLSKKETEEGTSAALIRGMAAGLAAKGFETAGGFNAYVTSNVLIGAGLSSSAAFEVIIGTIISGLFHGGKISPVEIAKTAQYSENVYFGKPCGLMDQMACSVGGLIHIDFQNPEAPVVRRVAVDFDSYQYSLCIVDTKGSHSDLTEDYAQIPMEMKQVAAFFGKAVLREVDEQAFFENIPRLRTETGDRAVLRAMHFFAENRRAKEEADALEAGQFDRFLELVQVSGNSSFQFLQNVYTNKNVREQGVSLGLAVSEGILAGHGVSRVHGGGFAGTIQAFVENGFVETYRNKMDHVFGAGACHVLKVRSCGGIKMF